MCGREGFLRLVHEDLQKQPQELLPARRLPCRADKFPFAIQVFPFEIRPLVHYLQEIHCRVADESPLLDQTQTILRIHRPLYWILIAPESKHSAGSLQPMLLKHQVPTEIDKDLRDQNRRTAAS